MPKDQDGRQLDVVAKRSGNPLLAAYLDVARHADISQLTEIQAQYEEAFLEERQRQAFELFEPIRMDDMCCRMLGVVNGRDDFAPSIGLQWGANGELQQN